MYTFSTAGSTLFSLKHEPERFERPSQNTCDFLPDFSDRVIFEYLEVSQNFPSDAKVCEDLDTPLARAP